MILQESEVPPMIMFANVASARYAQNTCVADYAVKGESALTIAYCLPCVSSRGTCVTVSD